MCRRLFSSNTWMWVSRFQVLTDLNFAWLQWSYKNWYFQVDVETYWSCKFDSISDVQLLGFSFVFKVTRKSQSTLNLTPKLALWPNQIFLSSVVLIALGLLSYDSRWTINRSGSQKKSKRVVFMWQSMQYWQWSKTKTISIKVVVGGQLEA